MWRVLAESRVGGRAATRRPCPGSARRSTMTRVTLPAAIEPAVVGHRHGEDQPAALDLLEGGLGLGLASDRGRCQMVELDAHADRRLPGAEVADERGAGRFLAQRHDSRSGEHRHVTRRHRTRRVGIADDEIRLAPQAGFQRHRRYDTASFARRSSQATRMSKRLRRRPRGSCDRGSRPPEGARCRAAHGGDFAEVFAEDRRASSAALDDGKVEELSSGRDRGAGIRVVVGETTGYAHTRPICPRAGCSPRPRPRARRLAAAAAGRGSSISLGERCNRPNEVTTAPESVAKAVKVELLKRADAAARAAGASIVQVSAAYGDSRRRILVANSDGLLAEDDQVKTLFRVQRGGERRHRHADRLRVGRAHRSASSCSTATTSRSSLARPPSARCSSCAPDPRPRVGCPS